MEHKGTERFPFVFSAAGDVHNLNESSELYILKSFDSELHILKSFDQLFQNYRVE